MRAVFDPPPYYNYLYLCNYFRQERFCNLLGFLKSILKLIFAQSSFCPLSPQIGVSRCLASYGATHNCAK